MPQVTTATLGVGDRALRSDVSARRWAMAILFVVSVFNYLDRNMLAVLQIPIKAELRLSDAQMGLLTGTSFALLYAIAAIPVARLADGWVRKHVLLGSLAVWSAATALTAAARGFGSLAVARMAVAAGESGCIPTSHALISDYYPAERRAGALGLWALSAPVGTMIGLALAGGLANAFDWRTVYLAAGLASAAFAPVVWFKLREPRRGQFDRHASVARPDLRSAIAPIWRNPALRNVILGVTFHAYFLYAQANWAAPFYHRAYGLSLGELSLWLGLLAGLAGGFGTWLGGCLADAWSRRNPAAYAPHAGVRRPGHDPRGARPVLGAERRLVPGRGDRAGGAGEHLPRPLDRHGPDACRPGDEGLRLGGDRHRRQPGRHGPRSAGHRSLERPPGAAPFRAGPVASLCALLGPGRRGPGRGLLLPRRARPAAPPRPTTSRQGELR